MNGRISFAVVIAFTIVFSALLGLNYAYSDPEKKDHPFFLQTTKNNKVLILGSSHVGILNTTLITESVFNEHPNYDVFNLAYSNDKPKIRAEILQQMIFLEPDIVFYGISYRDFGYHQYEDQFIPKRSLMIEKMLQIQNKNVGINPKLITLKAIQSIIPNLESKQAQEEQTQIKVSKEILHTNAPFFPIQPYYTDVATKSELNRDGNIFIASQIYMESNDNEQIENFKNIISEFQKNGIEVVLFTIPHHKLYLDAITPESKFTFKQNLEDVKDEYNVKIYDLQENYIDFPYWYDVEHIAYIPESMNYSKEISSIINMEIDS